MAQATDALALAVGLLVVETAPAESHKRKCATRPKPWQSPLNLSLAATLEAAPDALQHAALTRCPCARVRIAPAVVLRSALAASCESRPD